MKRFLIFAVIAVIAYSTRETWINPAKNAVASSVDSIRSWSDSTDFSFSSFDDFLDSLFGDFIRNDANEWTEVEPPSLTEPDEQLFSIHSIELGDSREFVEEELGEEVRSSENEYSVDWYTYHKDYHHFVMVAYDDDDVVKGLYTNQDLIASPTEITHGSEQQHVRNQLGEPASAIQKGLTSYQMNDDQEHDLFQLDNSYVTIFYDEHQDTTVTAIQIIDQDLEQNKNSLYAEPSQELKEGFEYQLFDLTNAARIQHELPILEWDDAVRETARKHSTDMADNNYFNHTNLEGQSPFDRMQEDNIRFTTAGENLAFGQMSSIFAHEGLMNSLGHRESILHEDFRNLGVGVDFNDDAQPFYTEKFFTS